MSYRLLTTDMDGTVLNSQKKITPRTEQAIRRALACGKEIIFATGRCPSEMREYLAQFPEMRYAMCLSGALILDLPAGKPLVSVSFPKEVAAEVVSLAGKLNAMVTLYAGDDVYVERKRRGNMAYFGCECFAALYDGCAVWVDEIEEVLEIDGDNIHKINLFCHSTADWSQAGEVLGHLPLSFAQGIPNNYEVSPQGINKGTGLTALCRAAGISIKESVAVGDSDNDFAMIKTAGLGVAMENATAEIRSAADILTADCDHDGVAKVIETYLLAGESI